MTKRSLKQKRAGTSYDYSYNMIRSKYNAAKQAKRSGISNSNSKRNAKSGKLTRKYNNLVWYRKNGEWNAPSSRLDKKPKQ